MRYHWHRTRLGLVGIAEDDGHLCRLLFVGSGHPVAGSGRHEPSSWLATDVFRQLDEFLDGGRTAFSLPLAPAATAFTRSVRDALLAIPFGQTASYREIASSIGRPQASRAVGTACACNLLPVIVPCHRVVRSDGAPGGYLGGAFLKTALLEHERRNAGGTASTLRLP